MEKSEEEINYSIKKLKTSKKIEIASAVSWSGLTAFCGYTLIFEGVSASAITLSLSALIVAASGYSIHRTNNDIKELENEKKLVKTKED